MSGYSEQSQRLARALAEKAADNLRRSGHTVTRSAETGRYVVESGGGEVTGVSKGGRGARHIVSKGGGGRRSTGGSQR
jgi:hypothetical protein